MINVILKDYCVQYSIDLHSHSKEYGSFVYSCENSEIYKMFSYFFTKDYPECVYSKCKVSLTPDKKCTFRGQMYHKLAIKNSFTIETSFYGYIQKMEDSTNKLIAFTPKNYQNIAKSILFALKETEGTKFKSEETKNVMNKI
jgi:hypothetical protein